ncbi:MAG: Rad52/Rad22 family DNA repair protein [Ktedonobacteraceae bacterium]
MTTPFSPITLQQIAEPLGAPFPPTEIKFLPKFPQQREGKWFCLAYPYADKRAYEDRLNALAYGHWQTPPPIALATANKLIIFVTVVLCGIPHTDVGEAFLSRVSRKGEAREEENTATAAYSQAFRRACAQFGLGRYLYTLPKLWLPYNPQERVIALSADEKQQTVERLYRKAGLLAAAPPAKTSKPAVSANASQHHGPSSAQKPDERAAENGHISADELAWVRQQLGDDAEQIAEVCQRY